LAGAGISADHRSALAHHVGEEIMEHLVGLRNGGQCDALHRFVDHGGRGVPAKDVRRDRSFAGKASGPPRGVRNLCQRSPALLLQLSGWPPIQARQHALTRQNRHCHGALPLSVHHGQRRSRTPQRDPRIDVLGLVRLGRLPPPPGILGSVIDQV
jgi:hypothetical protein